MSEELIQAVREAVEAFNVADWDRLGAVVTEDTAHEEPGTGRRVQGRTRSSSSSALGRRPSQTPRAQ